VHGPKMFVGTREPLMTTNIVLTLEEFERLPEQEGAVHELNEGELVVMTPGRPRHNRVRDNIAVALRQFVRSKGLGDVFIETGFELSKATVRIPDAAFVHAEKMKTLDLDQPWIDGAPALAIEVVSPNDLAEELSAKIDQYREAGVSAVWVLYPKTREVHVFSRAGMARTIGEKETLEDKDVVPGFSIPVSVLFE